MKLSVNKLLAASLIITSATLLGCVDSEKDFFDPSYKTENPMGDISAPEEFDWKMTNISKITVESNDEYNGKYFYIIEIYNGNPQFSSTYQLLGKGVSKENIPFSTEITYPKGTEYFYIKQIDPKGLTTYKRIDVNQTINCSFKPIANHLETRSIDNTKRATDLTQYAEIPSDAQEVTGSSHNDWFKEGKNYKITKNYNGGIYHSGISGTPCKLFISGTWTVPATAENWMSKFNNGIEVIIMKGGKIVCENSTLEFNGSAHLCIMEGGTLKSKSLYLTNIGQSYSLGTMDIQDSFRFDSGVNFCNIGIINALNANLKFDNNNIFTNEGILKIKSLTMVANASLINNCSISVTELFSCNSAGATIHLNQGAITARDYEFNNATINLNNGSMIKASRQILNIFNVKYTHTNGDFSLVKSPKIGYGWGGGSYTGNIFIETNKLVNDRDLEFDEWTLNNQISSYYKVDQFVQEGKYDESNIVIETCAGTENGGNQDGSPNDPDFPIVVPNNSIYTYIFEDQWPLYGDYDMNDVVFQISNITQTINAKNEIDKLEFNLTVQAVGASKKIGIALQLDDIYNEFIDDSSFPEVEYGTDRAVFPIIDDVHDFLAGSVGKEKRNFINTIKNTNNWKAKNTPLTIQFKSGVPASSVDISKLNFFLITEERPEGRKEIHLAGYQPTKRANPIYFNSGNDNSNRKSYISQENLAWGILIPGEFKWPQEFINIKEAYRGFAGWVSSGGVDNTDWANKDMDSDKIY